MATDALTPSLANGYSTAPCFRKPERGGLAFTKPVGIVQPRGLIHFAESDSLLSLAWARKSSAMVYHFFWVSVAS